MKLKSITLIIPISVLLFSSCLKEFERTNVYDPEATIFRDYTMKLDRLEIVEESGIQNGLIELEETVVIDAYFTNEGPDPGVMQSVSIGLKESMTGIWGGISENGPSSPGKWANDPINGSFSHVIDPGVTDYTSFQIATYDFFGSDKDIPLVAAFWDYDGQIRTIDFSIHIE